MYVSPDDAIYEDDVYELARDVEIHYPVFQTPFDSLFHFSYSFFFAFRKKLMAQQEMEKEIGLVA